MRAGAVVFVLVMGACVLVTGACYQPTVLDCAITCTQGDTCAAGQICGADGFCASPEVAGTCGDRDVDASLRVDAGSDTIRAADARPGADARVMVALALTIVGHGHVTVAPLGVTCTGDDKANGTTCSYQVALGSALSLQAASGKKDPFAGWSGACAGDQPSCALVAAHGLSVTATFAHE